MSIVTLLLIAAAVIFVYKGVIIVKQAEVVIIERLGKFERILESGLNFIFPIINKTCYTCVCFYERCGVSLSITCF